MKSPFPGMDPFLESSLWTDFHDTYNTVLRELLVPTLRPSYVVNVEERLYVERFEHPEVLSMRPDVVIQQSGIPGWGGGSALAVVETGNVCDVVVTLPEEVSETYLVIRSRSDREVVTIIETLSPANKRPGMNGHDEYVAKRKVNLLSQAHFVELDLLRGGVRPPVDSCRHEGDYFALISRARQRPSARLHHWTLQDRMPTIRIPLRGDEEVSLDLQLAFDTVYDRAGYDLSINYDSPIVPPLTPEQLQSLAHWRSEFPQGRA